MKYTMKEIRESLPERKSRVSSFWVGLFARRMSFFLTYAFINMGLSANLVSVLSCGVALAGCVLLSLDSFAAMAAGVLLINLWIVLDCVDGNIARCRGQSSEMGEFFDAVSGYVISAFSVLAIGIAAFNTSPFMGGSYNEWFIAMGAAGSISNILSRLIYQKFTNSRLLADRKRGGGKAYVPENHSFYTNSGKVDITYLRLRIDRQLGVSGLFMPFLIAALFLEAFDIMVVFYSAYNILSAIATAFLFLLKAKRYDDKKSEALIGYTSGVFDMFHIGHLNLLKRAKEKCDYLIVAVIDDEVVEAYKSKRPIVPMDERMRIIESTRFADRVVADYSRDKMDAHAEYGFNIAFIGDDWKGTKRWNKIEAALHDIGVSVEYLPYTEGVSSSLLREKLAAGAGKEYDLKTAGGQNDPHSLHNNES